MKTSTTATVQDSCWVTGIHIFTKEIQKTTDTDSLKCKYCGRLYGDVKEFNFRGIKNERLEERIE